MDNRFEQVMKERSNKELIQIITVESHKYEEQAIKAAKVEAQSRKLSVEFNNEEVRKVKEEFDNIEITNKNKVSKEIRVIHLFVDQIIFYIIFAFSSGIIFGGVSSIFGQASPILLIIYFLALYVFYYGISEFYFQKTIGKMLTSCSVVKNNGDKMSFGDALSRSACRLIPLNSFSFLLFEFGWHDMLSDTKVVKDNP